ncbi:TPA: hydrolase TatD [Candidatus Sumerlaeota bacterium]|jgi:TatD DNase family protein|nr:hydrolase TatD [Candidatus Sumerlaeota bacterium]
MTLIDTHCHLADEKFHDDLDAVLQRAHKVGVDRVVVVGDQLASSRDALELAKSKPELYCIAGVHPHNASQWNDEAVAELRALCAEGKACGKLVAVGEIGLDFYYDLSPRDQQIEAFLAQVEIAREFKLPISFHVRNAYDLFIEVVREKHINEIPGVVHCFGGTAKQGAELVKMGFLLGVTGVLTFKKNDDICETVHAVPLDALILETDGPYLAPVPHRGKRNEPAFLHATAMRLAHELMLPLEEVAARTMANAKKLFRFQD